VVWLGWCGIRMQAEACIRIPHHLREAASTCEHLVPVYQKSRTSRIGKPFACTTRNGINFYKIQEHKLRNSLIEYVEKTQGDKTSQNIQRYKPQ